MSRLVNALAAAITSTLCGTRSAIVNAGFNVKLLTAAVETFVIVSTVLVGGPFCSLVMAVGSGHRIAAGTSALCSAICAYVVTYGTVGLVATAIGASVIVVGIAVAVNTVGPFISRGARALEELVATACTLLVMLAASVGYKLGELVVMVEAVAYKHIGRI